MEKKKRKLSVPHTYVIIGIILVIVTLMTYVIPAGQYDRVMDEASGQEIIVTGSYHHVEQTPVGPFKMVTALAEGMVDASDIIFFCFFAYGLVYMMIKTGAFYGGVSALKRVMRGKEILILPVSASLSPWAMTAWWAERQSYWASSLGLRQRHSIRLPSVLHKASPDYPSDQGLVPHYLPGAVRSAGNLVRHALRPQGQKRSEPVYRQRCSLQRGRGDDQ